ncbi:NAD(P)H-binding protein [Nonomuraea phyllanthi]|uniref:NAD(P)H-binding protein n=1 Tax=Nonomuraea phyllanthi TaxID=2219224 RepID=A0A5C4VH28_9ACTN|nr:SDR family oxidoreductase [Nonomuraea phyllanthi]KAB8188929.1 NAD(P)H-binding protein [Nonomuraea phyllanthi]QFY09494.1 NAD(P)H-binding protein [Nonomuraea phyllanthi]
MRLTVFGATGGTGLQLVRQALDLGHDVTAVVRDASRLPAELRERVEVAETNVMDPQAITPAVEGRDAVLTALGTRDRGPTTVLSDGIASVSKAMTQVGGRRLLMVSAAGLVADTGDGPFTRYVLKPLVVQRLFRHSYADLAEAERLLRAGDLDWTIVRPARLTNAPRSARYRTERDLSIRGGGSTSRADLAHCMLALIDDPTSIHHAISVAS